MIQSFIDLFTSDIMKEIWKSIIMTAPVWIPLGLLLSWWDMWMRSKQRTYIKEQGALLLEVKIPRDMAKSPQAMEIFLNTLHQPSVGSLLDVYFKGRVRAWFSLELVSIGGTVHFYIWTHPKFRGLIESQLYAQFPDIEVHEVPDYALGVHRDPEKLSIGWIGQMKLTKADAYPIKTYIDYKLDKDPKEEYKHDPIVPMLEWLGSLKKGEQAWVQILIQGHSKEGLKYGRIVTKPDWKGGIDKEIKEIVKKATLKPEDDKAPKFIQLSEGQKAVVDAIQRAASKPAFDTMIRCAYMAEKSAFNPNNIGGLLGSFKQYGSGDLNGFAPGFNAGFDYPWQDFRGSRKAKNETRLLEAYKRRSFFNTPFKHFHAKPFILTAEELATMWHFPSAEVAATPTLSRIPSKKGEAPANLPI
jgi:hypothetical protein